MRELSGNSTARGRNGWFVPRRITARVIAVLGFPSEVCVDITSKQAGHHAPITLWLSLDDAKLIVGEITNAVVDAENSAQSSGQNSAEKPAAEERERARPASLDRALDCGCNLPFSQCAYHTAKHGPLGGVR
jgi:hypothetical protein